MLYIRLFQYKCVNDANVVICLTRRGKPHWRPSIGHSTNAAVLISQRSSNARLPLCQSYIGNKKRQLLFASPLRIWSGSHLDRASHILFIIELYTEHRTSKLTFIRPVLAILRQDKMTRLRSGVILITKAQHSVRCNGGRAVSGHAAI